MISSLTLKGLQILHKKIFTIEDYLFCIQNFITNITRIDAKKYSETKIAKIGNPEISFTNNAPLLQLHSMSQVKDRLHKFILSHLARDRVPLCINPMSAAYKSFARLA